MAAKGRVRFSEIADDASLDVVTALDIPPTSAPLRDLAYNPDNPRDDYDDVDELAASLAEAGQVQAITVVPREVFLAHYPHHADTIGTARWVVIGGNRRLAAAHKAGLRELTMTVRDRLVDDDQRIPEATLIENIHRQALPPLLEARELQALVKRHGSQSKLAKRLSKTQGWISQRLALLKLTPELQDELRKGAITVEEARTIATKPPAAQQPNLALLRRNRSTAAAPANPKPTTHAGSARATKATATKQRTATIRLDNINDTAADLREHLNRKDLTQLGHVLLGD